MPLHPQAEALLTQMRDAGARPFEELTVREAREAAAAFKDLEGAPESGASVTHRFVTGPTADLPIAIYRPEGDGPFPALLYFHGSGWVILNIDVVDIPLRALANRTGCVMIAVNYQKAPEHKFPTAFDDCYAALQWVVANAEELDIDPTRIGVGGDSAGGNLAAATPATPARRCATSCWCTRSRTTRSTRRHTSRTPRATCCSGPRCSGSGTTTCAMRLTARTGGRRRCRPPISADSLRRSW
jgi:acetyl esterase